MRPVGSNINKVEILHIRNLPIRPHLPHLCQPHLHQLLRLFPQPLIHSLPHPHIIENHQHRARIIIKPHLYPNLLEQVSILGEMLDLSVAELEDFVVGGVDEGVEFEGGF